MKQAIIRIKQCQSTRLKTISKDYFCSYNQFVYDAPDYIKDNLMPEQEVEITVGRSFVAYVSYEELIDRANEKSISVDDAIDDFVDFVSGFVKSYLPRY